MISILTFPIFLYSIILHEIAHGLMAERLGDPTARINKRLTLNPIPHLDLFMSVILPFFLFFSGSPIIFGSAKPVPIDPYNLRNPKKDMGLIGLAGPATNLALAIIAGLLVRLSLAFFPSQFVLEMFYTVARINIVLAVFNLTPIPPLDGGRVLVGILPEKYSQALASIENFGMFIVIFFLLFPNPLFSLQGTVTNVTSFLLNLIFPNFPLI